MRNPSLANANIGSRRVAQIPLCTKCTVRSSRAVAEAHFKSFVSVIHATFNRFPITQKVKTRTISHARSINLKITVEFPFLDKHFP